MRNEVSRGKTYLPPADGSSTGAYRRCSRLANASEAALTTLRCRFGHFRGDSMSTLTGWFDFWGFLLVFYSDRSPTMHRFCAKEMEQTEIQGWTDGRTTGDSMYAICKCVAHASDVKLVAVLSDADSL